MGFIAYPPNKHQTDSPSIFFIGSSEKTVSIKNLSSTQDKFILKAGNFCPVFNLELGNNQFHIELDGEQFDFEILRSPLNEIRKQSHDFKSLKLLPQLKNFQKICLDPGHGGFQRGTCSPKGVLEKDLNLIISNKLLQLGDFLATRTDDIDLSLEDRVNIATENECDLFVSIHHNAIPDHLDPKDHYGVSVHYYYEDFKNLAKTSSAFLASRLEMENNGAIRQNLHVLRENTKMPALLLELGYLIHPEESELITSDKHINLLVKTLRELFRHIS